MYHVHTNIRYFILKQYDNEVMIDVILCINFIPIDSLKMNSSHFSSIIYFHTFMFPCVNSNNHITPIVFK